MDVAEQKPSPPRKRKRQLLVAVFLIVLGLILMTVAIMLITQGRAAELRPSPGDLQSRSAPSSKKPPSADVARYTVAPNSPRYIDIPAIGVAKTRVKHLGLMSNNKIAEPDNIYDTGWYNGSAKPGQNGAMFIFGHVSSWQANGTFHDLKKLKPGDKVYVTRGDNKKFTYKVIASKAYSHQQVDMGQVLSPIDAGKPGLNLMTCTGKVIKGTNDFSERLVVFTSLIGT